jgi:hypothetical protein
VSRRRSQWGAALTAAVLIAAGFAVGVVEMLKLPKGSIWLVVAAALVLVLVIRRLSR